MILGNTHISDNYMPKIDHLGQSGVLQKVLNLSHLTEIKNSPLKFFQTSANLDEISSILENILSDEKCYFSAMLSKTKLGEIIKNSALLKDEIKVAENFLNEIKKANL